MEAKALPGTPWEGEISLGNSSGGPPEDNNEFFFGPGGLRERFGNIPGRLLEPSWRPRGPRRPPGAILAPFLEPKWSPEASFFKLFLDTLGLYFGHLRPLLSQASRLCCCWVFAWGRFPSFSFRPVLSARGQSRAKNGAPRPNFQHSGNYSGGRHFNSFGPAECAKRLNKQKRKEK